MDTSILAGFVDLNMILPNLAIGWQLEAAKARRIADLYKRLSDPADRKEHSDTLTPEGRAWITRADWLEKRVAAAREGYVFCDLADTEFNDSKWAELITHARVQGRLVEAWPLISPDGAGLTAEARLGRDPAPFGADLAGFKPDLSWTR
jgi:hypothetical protein